MVCPRNKFSFPRWSISSNTPKALGPFFPPSKCTITGVLLSNNMRNICTSQNKMFSHIMFFPDPMKGLFFEKTVGFQNTFQRIKIESHMQTQIRAH